MDSTGLSAFIALCITTEISRPAQHPQLALVRGEQVDGRRPGSRVVAARSPPVITPGGAEQPGQRVGERGLAAAALPGQAEHLAAVQHQVGVYHGVHRVRADAVIDAQPADLEQRLAPRHRGFPSPSDLPIA